MLKRMWDFRALHWAFGGGLIASLCCLGPPLAVLLGLSGASFLTGLTLWSPYFYVASFLLLAAAFVFVWRRQRNVCSIEEQLRNRWVFPVVMVGVMLGSYLLVADGVAPLLTEAANERLQPDQANVLDMSAMGMPGSDASSMSKTDGAASTQGMPMPADAPMVFAAGGSVTIASAASGASGLRRADLVIDKMT